MKDNNAFMRLNLMSWTITNHFSFPPPPVIFTRGSVQSVHSNHDISLSHDALVPDLQCCPQGVARASPKSSPTPLL